MFQRALRLMTLCVLLAASTLVAAKQPCPSPADFKGLSQHYTEHGATQWIKHDRAYTYVVHTAAQHNVYRRVLAGATARVEHCYHATSQRGNRYCIYQGRAIQHQLSCSDIAQRRIILNTAYVVLHDS